MIQLEERRIEQRSLLKGGNLIIRQTELCRDRRLPIELGPASPIAVSRERFAVCGLNQPGRNGFGSCYSMPFAIEGNPGLLGAVLSVVVIQPSPANHRQHQ